MSNRKADSEINQIAPKINGDPLPEGYGVEICADVASDYDSLTGVIRSYPVRYIAWLTQRNLKGEYEKVREIEPGATIEMEFPDGSRVWYRDGVGHITRPQTPVEIAIALARNA